MARSLPPGSRGHLDTSEPKALLLQFISRLVPLASLFALFYLGAAWLLGNARLAGAVLVLLGLMGSAVAARRVAHGGDLARAAKVLGYGMLAFGASGTWFLPSAYATLLIGSIAALITVLPYVRGAELRTFVATAFATSIFIGATASFSHAPPLPPLVSLVTVVGGTSVATYLVLVLLFQFNTRLRHTLDTTLAANDALKRAREGERAGKERLGVLAEAGEKLAASLDYEALLTTAAELAVPILADLCIVDVLDDSGRVRRVTSRHAPGPNEDALRDLERRCPADWNSKDISKILGTSRPVLLADISASLAAIDLRALEGAGELQVRGARSYMAVPLASRDRILGVFFFGLAESGRTFSDADVTFANELASRAGTAIENARLYRQAQDANRLKDEFLATLSHELRTPLQAILGWSHILKKRGSDPATLAKGLAIVERSAKAQEKLIEDLLDISRVMAGKIVLRPRAVDPDEVVRGAVEAVRPMATARQIEIETTIEPGLGMLMADVNRLQQVIWNLLTNAAKFSARGGRIEVTASRRGRSIEIRVADHGDGIAPDFLPYVFDRFRQADSSSTRRHGGLGIGLAIVRQLAELHGGAVHAESDGIGKGAAFTVTLPVEPTVSGEPAVSPVEERLILTASARLAGIRVLVVDDEVDARELLAELLTDEGAEVLTASSSSEALAILGHETPNLVISDVGMPTEDGYAFLAKARALTQTRKAWMPAVAVTAYAGADNAARALRCGFQLHLTKPVRPAEFIEAVERLTQRRPQSDAPRCG